MNRLILGAVAGLAMLFMAGCGDDSASTTQTFNGKGSTWEMTFEGSTFSATESDSSVTVSGTFEDLTTGFRKMTVSSASGTGAPAAGSTFWGVVIPGVAIMFYPILSSETKPIALVRKGTCPSSSQDYNWLMAAISNNRNTSSSSNDYFGTFSWNGSSAVTVNTGYALDNSYTQVTSGDGESYSGSCTNGVITVGTGNNGGTIYLTSAGPGMIATTGGDSDLIYGVPAETLSAQTALAGNYAGLIYEAGESTNADRFKPASVVVNAAGTSGTVTIKDGVDTTSSTTGTATLALSTINSPSKGLVKGTVTSSAQTGNMAMAVLADIAGTGKSVVFGVGQTPGNTSKGYVVLLVEKDSTASNTRAVNPFIASLNWIKSLFGF